MAISKKVSIRKPNLAAQAFKLASSGSTSMIKGAERQMMGKWLKRA